MNRFEFVFSYLFEGLSLKIKQLFFKRKLSHKKINKINFETLQGGKIIKDLIAHNKPFAAIRLGSTECSAFNNYHKVKFGLKKKFPDSVKFGIKFYSGFFPPDDENIYNFGKLLEKELPKADVCGELDSFMEKTFLKSYCKKSYKILNKSFDPLKGMWTSSLRGKKVLVISSFSKDIESQYKKREKIFPSDPSILPEFDLITLQAPITFGSVKPKDKDFFIVLRDIENKIKKIDFDIAIVGCGAYGLFISTFIKNIGKQAIQTAGSTQLLFGITGNRWKDSEVVKKYLNEEWIRPSEKPEGFENIEGGCYW